MPREGTGNSTNFYVPSLLCDQIQVGYIIVTGPFFLLFIGFLGIHSKVVPNESIKEMKIDRI